MTEAFPWDTAPRYLLRDRDQSYGLAFRHRVRAMGITEVITAPRSPWQNPYVELTRTHLALGKDCPRPRHVQPPSKTAYARTPSNCYHVNFEQGQLSDEGIAATVVSRFFGPLGKGFCRRAGTVVLCPPCSAAASLASRVQTRGLITFARGERSAQGGLSRRDFVPVESSSARTPLPAPTPVSLFGSA